MQGHNDESTQNICMHPRLPELTIYNVLLEISLLTARLDLLFKCPFVPRQWSLKNNFSIYCNTFRLIRVGINLNLPFSKPQP
jgi:hypothetical protein